MAKQFYKHTTRALEEDTERLWAVPHAIFRFVFAVSKSVYTPHAHMLYIRLQLWYVLPWTPHAS